MIVPHVHFFDPSEPLPQHGFGCSVSITPYDRYPHNNVMVTFTPTIGHPDDEQATFGVLLTAYQARALATALSFTASEASGANNAVTP